MKEIRVVRAIIRYKRNESARYLLLQKSADGFNEDNVRKWECAGGLIDKGETSEQAAIRETREETGLEGRVIKQLPTLIMKDGKTKSTCDVYLIETSSMDVHLDPKEHLDHRWLKAEEVKNMDLVLYAGMLLEFFNNPEKYLN